VGALGGGLVATALVALARLGATTRYVGKLGVDDFSEFIRAGFRREGVLTDAIVTRPEVSGRFSFILVEEGTGLRTILHSGHGRAQLTPEELDREVILSGRALLIEGRSSSLTCNRGTSGGVSRSPLPSQR
jgi:sugar/nucleoside kinase (ribokinase family)